MGYDIGECFICYINYGSNFSGKMSNVCGSCLNKYWEDKGRLKSYVFENNNYNSFQDNICEICLEKGKFMLRVNVCSQHRKTSDPDPDDDSD